MDNNNTNQNQGGFQQQPMGYLPPLPNATGALVLGILSIVFSFCYGIVGIILGIIGLILANKATQLFEQNPNGYSQPSLGNAKTGKILSIIGLVLSALVLIYFIIVLAFLGSILGNLPWNDFH